MQYVSLIVSQLKKTTVIEGGLGTTQYIWIWTGWEVMTRNVVNCIWDADVL